MSPFKRPVACGLVVSTAALFTLTAVPAPALADVTDQPLTSSASAQVLGLDALRLPGLPAVAAAGVATSEGTVTTTVTDGQSATADARNLDASVLGAGLPGLLAEASQTAPPDNAQPTVDGGAPGTVPGLLSLGISEAEAHARAVTGGCPTGPLTSSAVSTVGLSLLPVPTLGTLLALPDTVSTSQSTGLVEVDGPDTQGVASSARGSIASLDLLSGSVQVRVLSAPELTATATGQEGADGASVAYDAPVVEVTADGRTRTLPVDGSPLSFTSPDNPLLQLTLRAGQLDVSADAADGTQAAGSASVLEVRAAVLGAVPVLETELFPLEASATAPVGGIDCSLVPGDDTDGDGLTNAEETTQTGTDPRDTDSDDDGTTDDAEDPDGDGLTNLEEVDGSQNDAYDNAPTDPRDDDTDGDGLTDGEEIDVELTDPNTADTDGGGVQDGAEVDNGTDPLDPDDDTPLDPAADADGDGLTNGEETTQTGTDPRDT
ncbi:hypothetical protein, partial [Nocardioides aquaticus]